ncbi:MAG TPA: AsmA family protein [Thioalkalivibrio sp.]|nr:AsmA family protein [Thioalkalivibrio sp.]
MKWLKWASWAALAVVLVLAVAIGIFVATFDPNAYKEQITRGVHDATGRDLVIEGEIGLTFFPLGFSLGETRLSNAEGFGEEPFASVDEVGVRVAILPLLKNEVRVDRVVLRGLTLDLQRNAEGVSNWDDLVPAAEEDAVPAEAEAPREARPLPTIWVGGVDITEARVSWRDAQAGTELRLDPFNLTTGAFEFGEPMDLRMDFRIEQGSPVTVLTAALEAEVTADPVAGAYRIADLVLDAAVSGRDIPAGRVEARLAADIVANLEAQTAEVSGLRIDALGMRLIGAVSITDLIDDLKLTGNIASDRFSPRDVMRQLAMEVPETADARVLSKAELRADFSATTERADLKALTVVLDDTTLRGNAQVSNFESPAIGFGVTVDAINVDRYLPPTPREAAAPAEAADEPIELPVEMLRTLNLNGTADVGEVIVADVILTDIHATLAARNGLLRVEPYSLKLYSGVVNGKASLDVRGATPAYSVHQELKGMDMGALQTDMLEKTWLSGQTELVATLATSGDRISALKRGLNGNMSFAFSDGAIQDEKLARTVRLIETTIYEDQTTGEGGTQEVRFTSMKGTVTIRNGVATNKDLHVLTPILQAKGEGSVNLVEDRMDYSFGVAKLGGTRTFLYTTVKGPFSDLSYKPDLQRFAKDKLGDKVDTRVDEKKEELKQDLKEKAKDKLKGLFGR